MPIIIYHILFFEKKKSSDASTQTCCEEDCCIRPACLKKSQTTDQNDDSSTHTVLVPIDDPCTQTRDSQNEFEADSIIGSSKTVKRRLIDISSDSSDNVKRYFYDLTKVSYRQLVHL